ncbi:MAG: recombinase family protein, partial [Clostridiales bacterium]|nr:recombinase family protein [Clostridiales bacterium]
PFSGSAMNSGRQNVLDNQYTVKYIRLSQEDAKSDSLSIENQRLLLDRHIFESNMCNHNILELVDNGYTGTNFERPAVQELLDLVRAGKVGCILVKDFSRFGRNTIETGYFIERVFPLYRVRFISVDDGFDSFALDGDTGGIDVAFKFLVNEQYSRDLSVKIRTARREKALRGEDVSKNGVFGYTLDKSRKMVIDPKAAEAIKLIFEMYADKKSTADIAERLYRDGHPSPAVWKKYKRTLTEKAEFHCVWKTGVILSILKDEQYTGVYIAGKTKTVEIGSRARAQVAEEDWIRIPDHHEAIISRELFDTVQERFRVRGESLRKQSPNAPKRCADSAAIPLKGKVGCGHCGHAMEIINSKNTDFRCNFTLPAPDAKCHKLRIPNSELEKVVMENIKQQAEMVVASMGANPPQNPAVSEHEAMIENLQIERQRLYESVVLGDISREEYKVQKSAVDAELARAQQMLGVIRVQYDKRESNTTAVDAARKVLKEESLIRELVSMLIDKILIYPDKRVEIMWKLAGFADCSP